MSRPVLSTSTSSRSVEEVLGVLTSPSWAATRAERFGDDAELQRREERSDGGVLVVSSRALPDGVPGFLQRFLPADGRVLETYDWGPSVDGARRGTWQVEVPGAPATLGGTTSLVPTGSGCTHTVEGEVTVRVPLIGGKAETFLAGMVEQLAEKEAALREAQAQG